MRKNFKRSAVVGGSVAALFGTAIGFAAWTNYGEGSGSVTADHAQALTVAVTPVTGLFPTGSQDVSFTVTNPNPYAVKLTNVTLKSVAVDTAHSACNKAEVTGSDVTLSDVVPAGQTSGAQTFPVNMSNSANDDCQDAVFTVTLGVTGLSN
jgi:hypothetical protein